MIFRRTALWAGIWAAMAAAVVFLPVLRAEFVWDDRIVQRDQVPGLATARDALFPSPRLPQWSDAYYRPLVALSYVLDERLNQMVYGAPADREARLDPRRARIPHGMNLLWHAGASFLAALLLHRLLGANRRAFEGALAGGLLFAVHPIHVESVCNIAGRSDLLAALGLFGAALVAFSHLEKPGPARLAAFGLLSLLAFSAKEVALAGILLVPLLLYAAHGRTLWEAPAQRRGVLALGAAAALGLALYLLLRFAGGNVGAARFAQGAYGAWGDIPAALAYYLRFLLAPAPMGVFISRLPGALETTLALLAAAGGAVACAMALRKGNRLPAAGFAAALLPLAPALAVLPFSVNETQVAERYLYLPSFGLCVVAAYAAALPVWEKPAWRRAGAAALAALLALAAFADVSRARVWGDEYSLWSATSRTSLGARAGLVWVNLGKAARERGDEALAETCYRNALSPEADYDDEGHAIAWNNLAALRIGQAGDAAAQRRYALAVDKLLEAEKMLAAAMPLNPGYLSPALNMSTVQRALSEMSKAQTGRHDVARLLEARRYLGVALSAPAPDPRALQALGQVDQLLRLAAAQEKLR